MNDLEVSICLLDENADKIQSKVPNAKQKLIFRRWKNLIRQAKKNNTCFNMIVFDLLYNYIPNACDSITLFA